MKGNTETSILFGIVIFDLILFFLIGAAPDYLGSNSPLNGGSNFNSSSSFNVPTSGTVSTVGFLTSIFSLSTKYTWFGVLITAINIIGIYIAARLVRGGG